MMWCDSMYVQVRELFLKHKAAELDREMGIIKDQEEAGRHVRMLTNEIRSTLDRHTILNTTLVELAKTLELANCTIWEPNPEGDAVKLTHELDRRFLQVLVRNLLLMHPVRVCWPSLHPIVLTIILWYHSVRKTICGGAGVHSIVSYVESYLGWCGWSLSRVRY
jgi:hypothetical protein